MVSLTAPANTVFRAYLLVIGSAFAALGIQMVLFPYLVAVELHERPALIGIAQMAVMLPALLFLLPAGAIADRVNGKSFLTSYHLIASVPPLILSAVLFAGGLSYSVIISYALLMGTLSAFALPVREAMVARVMRGMSMQMAISAIVAAQFLTQLMGMSLVGLFDWVFPSGKTNIAEVMLVIQAVVFFAGVLAARALPRNEPAAAGGGVSARWYEIRDGLAEAMSNPSIMPVIIAMFAVGSLYVGSFFTIIPVLIRDTYHGDAGTFSLVNVAFWSGTIAANIAMMRGRGLVHQGRAIAIALVAGAVVLGAMSFPAPLWLLCGLCFLWGLGGGVTITLGRTIVQEEALPSHRGRIMSIYQFGFSGGVPFGALILGLIVEAVGPYQTARVGPVVMLLVVAALSLCTQLLSIKSRS